MGTLVAVAPQSTHRALGQPRLNSWGCRLFPRSSVLPKAPAPSLPRSPLPQGLCSQAESPQGDIVSLQALCQLSLSCPLPLTLQEGRAGRGILFPISCSPLPRAIPRDFAGLAYSRVVVLAGSLS